MSITNAPRHSKHGGLGVPPARMSIACLDFFAFDVQGGYVRDPTPRLPRGRSAVFPRGWTFTCPAFCKFLQQGHHVLAIRLITVPLEDGPNDGISVDWWNPGVTETERKIEMWVVVVIRGEGGENRRDRGVAGLLPTSLKPLFNVIPVAVLIPTSIDYKTERDLLCARAKRVALHNLLIGNRTTDGEGYGLFVRLVVVLNNPVALPWYALVAGEHLDPHVGNLKDAPCQQRTRKIGGEESLEGLHTALELAG